ncbi:MAG: NADH-quinone oxidoreductase subunit NuoK [Legionellales bacterium]|nr:NADH-quinone oxidoreductase subunit NuoK [Legionellales bacterium]|tara:strand:- start:6839 stop:7144 length:306 start_codon:yes stop_codon:yes gene_type:complete
MININHILFINLILFLIGLTGIFLLKKNLIVILMSIELMLLAVNLNFISSSYFLDDLSGQLFAIFILTVAAAESAIGLAILVVFYRLRGIISVDFINSIKG